MTKFEVTVSRKVQTRDFESVSVGLSAEFDDEQTGWTEAFSAVQVMVDQWIGEKKSQYEAERRAEQERQYDKVKRLLEA